MFLFKTATFLLFLICAGLSGAKVDVEQRDEKNATNLHYACTKGLHDLVKPLLELGANPNLVDAGVLFIIIDC